MGWVSPSSFSALHPLMLLVEEGGWGRGAGGSEVKCGVSSLFYLGLLREQGGPGAGPAG